MSDLTDRLDAIEQIISDIPEKARANPRYQDFFNVADVTALVDALRSATAVRVPFDCLDGGDVEVGAERALRAVRRAITAALT